MPLASDNLRALFEQQVTDTRAVLALLATLDMDAVRLTAAIGVVLTSRIEMHSRDCADCLENLNALLGPTIAEWACQSVTSPVTVQ